MSEVAFDSNPGSADRKVTKDTVFISGVFQTYTQIAFAVAENENVHPQLPEPLQRGMGCSPSLAYVTPCTVLKWGPFHLKNDTGSLIAY